MIFKGNKMKNNTSILSNEKVSKAIKLLHINQIGIVVVVKKDKKILGTITDGDIRRAMINKDVDSLSVSKIMNKNPIIGPKITLPIEQNKAFLNEKTLNLVKAIPKDIKIKKIVAYINKKVVFSINTGVLIS